MSGKLRERIYHVVGFGLLLDVQIVCNRWEKALARWAYEDEPLFFGRTVRQVAAILEKARSLPLCSPILFTEEVTDETGNQSSTEG